MTALGLTLALALVTPAAPAGDGLLEWAKRSLTGEGWAYHTRGTDTVFLYRKAASSGKYRRIWTRYETAPRTGLPKGESEVLLTEVDCTDSYKSRQLQMTRYREANMGGDPVTYSDPSPWRYPTPGTLGETTGEIACAPRD